MIGCTSLNLPVAVLMSTNARIPAEIPLAIEPVNTVNIIMTNGPKDSEKSAKSISLKPLIIKKPTKIRAGPVAALGIISTSGERNTIIIKITDTTTLVNPVRPPASTPALDSTKVVMTVLPVSAPTQVPMASTRNGC